MSEEIEGWIVWQQDSLGVSSVVAVFLDQNKAADLIRERCLLDRGVPMWLQMTKVVRS